MAIVINPTENETHRRGRKILQFWSGGADSTYLLLQNLLCGYDITTAYVSIKNNKTKCDREQKARNLLRKDIEKFCKHFHCQKPLYLPDQEICVLGDSFGYCPAPQQIIFAMFCFLIGNDYDEIMLGVVNGDSMQGSTFNKDLLRAYKKTFSGKFPDITYPIEKVSKEMEYLTLKGFDDTLGTEFIKHLTVCESVDKPCGKKKLCTPCRTQQRVFKRLKWIE